MSGRPLQAAIAKALGDPSLTLAYWLPEFGSYVDSDGKELELPARIARGSWPWWSRMVNVSP